MTISSQRRSELAHLIPALAGIAGVTLTYRLGLETNATTVALSYLLVVLFVAAASRLWVAVVTSIAAMAAFNFFFLPPIGTLTIVDPQNWIALFAFLGVSLVASRLSAVARDRAELATERAHLLEERKQAELAQRAAELKSALLSSLAHDLRTPLTAIRVAASNLNRSSLSDTQRAEQTDLIGAEVERLTRLFQNILEMTQIDAGAIAIERRWVHPLEIVEAAGGQVEHTLRTHELKVRGGPVDLVVKIDPRVTSAALAHLLENAAQYSPDGTPITVIHSSGEDGLLITVEDQGGGIDEDELPRLFDRFYRGAAASRYTAGTGMGLSITRGLVAAENGRVWAENRRDGGSRFSMLIPAEARPSMAAQE